MHIELKRFTTNGRLSQETTAFAADVWVDGKKVGSAENDGHGGATMVHLDKSVRDKVEAHGKALVPAEYASFTSGAEWVVDQLVEAELQKKHDKTFAKKIASADKKERERSEKIGQGAARFRHGDTWRWFGLPAGADPKTTADAMAAKAKAAVDELVVVCYATHHVRNEGRRPLTLVGSHVFDVTATASDGQTATAVVAADDEWKARTCLMLVKTTMKLNGQLVTYAVRQLDGSAS
ncbi:MAG TPA: hypothetical protein VLE97_06635 [Gaiellaceae bacterium]|nr:hypothetical protein [Gaiellaceae bacterium]